MIVDEVADKNSGIDRVQKLPVSLIAVRGERIRQVAFYPPVSELLDHSRKDILRREDVHFIAAHEHRQMFS